MSDLALPARGDSVQTWATPWHIVRAVERDSFGGVPFHLDCAAEKHTAKAALFYTPADDGLASPWWDATWCNPPYAGQDRWLARGVYMASLGIRSAHLVLASTSSKYWRRLTFEAGTVDFFEGRIAFLDDTGTPVKGASFSSALVLMGPGFPPMTARVRDAETGELVSRNELQVDLFGGGR
jgi:phage N-6-adenine-methyltransferase